MSALSLPLLGEWPAWMTVLVCLLVGLYVVQRLVHLAGGDRDDAPDVPQPGDMSTLTGWDEYVHRSRDERGGR